VTAASSEENVAAGQHWVLDKLAAPDLLSVAVVEGPITGVSLAVALACDLRVLSDDASLAVLDPSIFGCLGRLADLVGYARALELALTGRRMQAIEAAQTGLATVVAPADQLDATADDLVLALLSTPRGAAAEIKASLSASVLDASARRRRLDAELQAAQRLRSAGEQHE
jgi:enoyl-CoA hydratase/carnithine racemase